MGYPIHIMEQGLVRNTLSLEFELFRNLQTCYKYKINRKLNDFCISRFTRWNWQRTRPSNIFILGDASEDGCQEIIEMLINTRNFSIGDYNGALQCASSNGHVEVVQMMLSLGVNDLNMALHLAEQQGHTECAELLKKYGAESIIEMPL